MGWTSYRATNYDRRGNIDRKTEIRTRFDDSLEILKDAMVGSTYYAAVKTECGRVFGIVALTSVDMKDWCNFSYKVMDESMGPYKHDCPIGILNLLTETENEWGNKWREKCRKRHEAKKALKSLKEGTTIVVKGTEYTLQEYRNRLTWINWSERTYVNTGNILACGYTVAAVQ